MSNNENPWRTARAALFFVFGLISALMILGGILLMIWSVISPADYSFGPGLVLTLGGLVFLLLNSVSASVRDPDYFKDGAPRDNAKRKDS